MSEEETSEQTLTRLGAERVRLMLGSAGLPMHLHGAAVAWLAEQDERERLRDQTDRESQRRQSVRVETATWIAAVAAVIAAIAAIVSVVMMLRA